jgi:hypothetical protein
MERLRKKLLRSSLGPFQQLRRQRHVEQTRDRILAARLQGAIKIEDSETEVAAAGESQVMRRARTGHAGLDQLTRARPTCKVKGEVKQEAPQRKRRGGKRRGKRAGKSKGKGNGLSSMTGQRPTTSAQPSASAPRAARSVSTTGSSSSRIPKWTRVPLPTPIRRELSPPAVARPSTRYRPSSAPHLALKRKERTVTVTVHY